jgi:FtsP/CotA-like multicopper oxidase with cupredoxin domain
MPDQSMASLRRRANISRRRLLAASSGAGGALLLASAGRRSMAQVDATPEAGHTMNTEADSTAGLLQPEKWEPAELIEPDVRQSDGGQLRTDLVVRYAYHDIGGYRLHLRAYEGTTPGPTIRVRPGDVLRVTLLNDLPPNRDPMPQEINHPHHFNTTNVHVHGLHVSPSGFADNVLRPMEPGQSYDIEIAIPEDHPSGTYWYHPHNHGSADVQISSGMAGALIVEGDFDDVPEIVAATERVLILNEVLFDYLGTIETYDTLWPEAVPRFLSVNGQREPIIRMRPGEVQRWRMVQGYHEDNVRLGLDDHELHLIASDGIAHSQVDRVETLVMAPGQRADVLVQAGEPGRYLLRALPNDQGYPSPTGPLAHVVVEGEPVAMTLPAALPAGPLAPIGDDELTGARQLTFSSIEPEMPATATYQEFAFLIDGRRFDPDRVDQRIALGAVEEWTVVNDDHADHVFHIHTNPFQVTAINGEPLATPLWRDTVIVPRDGSLTFRSRFLDFTGKTVLHCHMMNHEELGMMQLIEFTE